MCVQGTGCGTDAEWRPPVAAELFDDRERFHQVLSRYPKAAALAQQIRARVASAGQNRKAEGLETVLRELSEEGDPLLQTQYWQIPLYLQDLLWNVTRNYVRHNAGTLFDWLVREVHKSAYDEVCYLTLNYDLFLEEALQKLHTGYTFDDTSKYIPAGHKWNVVKPHGSVNWGWVVTNAPLLVAATKRSTLRITEVLDVLPKLELDDRIRILDSQGSLIQTVGEVESSQTRIDVLYPVVAAPVGELKKFQCSADHSDVARRFLSGPGNVLVLGFSALDSDVLGLFRDCGDIEQLCVVNGSREGSEAAAKRIKSAASLSFTVADVTDKRGFSAFVCGGGLQGFLGV